MCLGKVKTPAPPPLPAPPPEPPKLVDKAVTEARDEQLKKAKAAAGYASTDLTKGGTSGVVDKGGKTALGQ